MGRFDRQISGGQLTPSKSKIRGDKKENLEVKKMMEISQWLAVIGLLIIAIVIALLYALRQKNNGWEAAKKKYHGKLMKKEALHNGMHYAVVAVTQEESPGTKSAFIIINGQRNPEDEDAGLFGVEIPLQEISNNDKLFIKAGDTIIKTMEGEIVIVPP